MSPTSSTLAGIAAAASSRSGILRNHTPPDGWIDVADIRRLRPDVLSVRKNPTPKAYLDNEDAAYLVPSPVPAFSRLTTLYR